MKSPLKSAPEGDRSIGLLGVPRSGTNFVRAVLELNYRCQIDQNRYGWKHGYLPVAVGNSRIGKYVRRHGAFAWVTKHPLDSIYSLYSYYSAVGRNIRGATDWPGFLRSPVFLFIGDNSVSPEYRFANPADLWNSLNWNYASAGKMCRIFHFKYEDAYLSPQTAFDCGTRFLGLERRSGGALTIPTERMKRLGPRKLENYEEYVTGRGFDKHAYYREREYVHKYSPSDLEFVISQIDHQLTEKLGYHL